MSDQSEQRTTLDRRRFLTLGCLGCSAALSPTLFIGDAVAEQANTPMRARFWESIGAGRVRCTLCPRHCTMARDERGYCGVRRNQSGVLRTLVYSRPCTVRADPIEKKPLFHYLPGTDAYSIATAGCNFECLFCQNWRISQFRPSQVRSISLSPRQVVEQAAASGSRSIAFTYSEPVVFYEYVEDISRLARERGIGRVMISNGFINREPMARLLDLLDGVKIDLKSFRDSFYRDLCDGELRPVLDTLRLVRQRGIWLEIVVLVIPSRNDSDNEMRAMARWITQELGPDVPLHLTRFHPTYRMQNIPRTPVSTIERLRNVAREEGLRYVYLGNVPGHEGEDTYCHGCGTRLIARDGFVLRSNEIRNGRCPHCHISIPGHWS